MTMPTFPDLGPFREKVMASEAMQRVTDYTKQMRHRVF